jgi:predicted short-subunit dehydrogenase-like oxidoreductase (DUF2520 family)
MKMNTKKVRNLVIAGAIVIASLLSACKDNPCANGSACGLTSPVTNAEQAVIDFIQPNQQNLLSGGN